MNLLRRQHGFGLIEVLAAIVISSLLFAGFGRMANDSYRQTKDIATAQHFKQFSDAATRYIQDNFATIQATATATTPATITTVMLSTSGYLSSSFSGVNAYAQSIGVEVLQPSAGNLQASVITVNGNAIPEVDASKTASLIGASGGYTPASAPTTAKGAFGGWSMALTNNTKPGAGHLVGLLYFNNGQLISDYLRRHSVPGHPEVNQMFTALDMNGQSITNGNAISGVNVTGTTVSAGSGNVALSNQASEGGLITLTGANGQVIKLENNNGVLRSINNASTQTWSLDQSGNTTTLGQANSATVSTKSLTDSDNTAYGLDPNGTSTLNAVNATTQTTSGTSTAGYFKPSTSVTAGTACSQNGLIAQNTAGNTMSCVSGVWATGGTGSGGSGTVGPVQLGPAISSTCDAATAGTVQYSSSGVFQGCNGTSWTAWTASVAPDPCLTEIVGTVCSDGTVFAGLSPVLGKPMYTTPCDVGMSGTKGACIGSRVLYKYGATFVGQVSSATSLADGKANTDYLIANWGAWINADAIGAPIGFTGVPAAQVCASQIFGGHNDWYLPSIGELSVLYAGYTNISGMTTDLYQSSSADQTYSSHVNLMNMSNGSAYSSYRWSDYNVRCVRKV